MTYPIRTPATLLAPLLTIAGFALDAAARDERTERPRGEALGRDRPGRPDGFPGRLPNGKGSLQTVKPKVGANNAAKSDRARSP